MIIPTCYRTRRKNVVFLTPRRKLRGVVLRYVGNAISVSNKRCGVAEVRWINVAPSIESHPLLHTLITLFGDLCLTD